MSPSMEECIIQNAVAQGTAKILQEFIDLEAVDLSEDR